MDITFPSTRECQLLQSIIEAVDQGDDEAFSDTVFQYDQLSKLDKWKTTMLLRVKESKLNPLPNLGGTCGLYLKY
jgi:alpha-soluble NSF attachment protein